jgi:HEPN superfamily protein
MTQTQTQAQVRTRTRATPFDLPAATHSYLARAASSLQEAMTTGDIPQRYACAHVAALRATAALLAARATPTLPQRRSRQKNAWVLLSEVAPEFGEWATFFAAGATKRAAAEAGSRRAVTEREADDLVRDADRFLGLVEESLGMTRHVPVDECLHAFSGGRAESAWNIA